MSKKLVILLKICYTMKLIKGGHCMEKFDNAEFLYSQIEKECNLERMPKEIYKLLYFTTENIFFKTLDSLTPFFNIKKKGNGYLFHYNEKDYYFEILSEKQVLPLDKKNLQNRKRRVNKSILRSLRIATTNDLVDQKLLFAASNILGVNLLVEYQKNGEQRIIDYSTNLIMKKADFFELFQPKIINTLDKETLYRYHENLEYLDDISLIYILLAGKEIMKNVGKLQAPKDICYFCPNSLNDKVTGVDCDGIFLDSEDEITNAMDEAIDSFTFDSTVPTPHIKKDSDHFFYQRSPFSKKVPFNTFDTYVNNQKVKSILQSKERYGHCHINSTLCLKALSQNYYDEAYIVSGKIQISKYHYVYHSWIEITIANKTFVIDFNRNVFMSKDDYYHMKKPIIINKTDVETIAKLHNYEEAFNLYLPTNLEVYFNEEFIKDFEKNKSLIKK